MEIDTLSKTLDLLERYWLEQGIESNKSNELEDIKLFEQKKGISLPDDFILYFQCINGMNLKYPMNFDKEGFLFYSLKQANTMADEFHLDDKSNAQIDPTKCLLFGEYMHKSWWYGVLFKENRNSYSIGIIPEHTKFRELSNNLSDFIQLYLSDSFELYNY